MSLNKLALIRYKTIDKCLQNRHRKWTLEDLIEACSRALFEYEGISNGIAKRTIQLDIQNMRSDKLGYNAPIIVIDKKFYTYEDPNYSITNSPITNQDLDQIFDVISVLKQFKGFLFFNDFDEILAKLEDKIYKEKHNGQSFIDFETNNLLKGISYIDPIYKAIINQCVLEITYQSFKARSSSVFQASPYLLKEYRNRWFVLLKTSDNSDKPMILALDRIISINEKPKLEFIYPNFSVDTYFNNVIGVTKEFGQKEINVILWANKIAAPYIITKPFHHSQIILKEEEGTIIFSIDVVWNFELEKEILAFGEQIKVLAPNNLIRIIKRRLKKSLENYSK